MRRKANSRSYQEFSDEDDDDEGDKQPSGFFDHTIESLEDKEPNGSISPTEDENRDRTTSRRVSKTCVKNFFTVVLILIYLLLTAVAGFLAYQTIKEVLNKLNNPVMSVTYQEVDSFPPPGIVLYPGNAQLLSCRHHFHNIPPLIEPRAIDCEVKEVSYIGPYSNKTERRALVVRGPSDVRNKEVIFMQFSCNETGEDFSEINYMIFAKYSDLINSQNKSRFMRECERNCSMWTFSGGFRTWVKMSIVKTSGKDSDSVAFRQESAVVKYNDHRPEPEKFTQLYFVVFQWRDPYIQQNKMIVTANPWSSFAILCGVLMALFKAANFAKLSVQWIIRMRKRHTRNKERELNQVPND